MTLRGNSVSPLAAPLALVAPRKSRRWWLLAVGALSVLGSSVIGYKVADYQRSPRAAAERPWHGKVGKVVRAGADKTGGLTADGAALADGAEVKAGMKLPTDGRTRPPLDFHDATSLV